MHHFNIKVLTLFFSLSCTQRRKPKSWQADQNSSPVEHTWERPGFGSAARPDPSRAPSRGWLVHSQLETVNRDCINEWRAGRCAAGGWRPAGRSHFRWWQGSAPPPGVGQRRAPAIKTSRDGSQTSLAAAEWTWLHHLPQRHQVSGTRRTWKVQRMSCAEFCCCLVDIFWKQYFW